MVTYIRKLIVITIITAFIGSSIHMPQASAQGIPWMPKPGVRVSVSPPFVPAHIQGLIIHADDALKFDFLIHQGEASLNEAQKKEEYQKLVKYFMASLTVPDENQWVNLSPYEKNRVVEKDFGTTEMGRDLLAQDYLLKQIASSLMYPEESLGKKFWNRVFERSQKELGTTNVPVNTINKVWIVPGKATLYEKGDTVYILENHLTVMMEEDYLALQKNHSPTQPPTKGHVNQELQNVSPSRLPSDLASTMKATQGNPIASQKTPPSQNVSSQVIREIIIPELEREVNEGKNFAPLRQVYSSVLLAAWYKRALKESLLGKVYANRAKVEGVNLSDSTANDEIYQQYLKAFKKGVFNYIKEDVDKLTNEPMPRKYFSGGTTVYQNDAMFAELVTRSPTVPASLAMSAEENLSKTDRASVVVKTAKSVDLALKNNSQESKPSLAKKIAKWTAISGVSLLTAIVGLGSYGLHLEKEDIAKADRKKTEWRLNSTSEFADAVVKNLTVKQASRYVPLFDGNSVNEEILKKAAQLVKHAHNKTRYFTSDAQYAIIYQSEVNLADGRLRHGTREMTVADYRKLYGIYTLEEKEAVAKNYNVRVQVEGPINNANENIAGSVGVVQNAYNVHYVVKGSESKTSTEIARELGLLKDDMTEDEKSQIEERVLALRANMMFGLENNIISPNSVVDLVLLPNEIAQVKESTNLEVLDLTTGRFVPINTFDFNKQAKNEAMLVSELKEFGKLITEIADSYRIQKRWIEIDMPEERLRSIKQNIDDLTTELRIRNREKLIDDQIKLLSSEISSINERIAKLKDDLSASDPIRLEMEKVKEAKQKQILEKEEEMKHLMSAFRIYRDLGRFVLGLLSRTRHKLSQLNEVDKNVFIPEFKLLEADIFDKFDKPTNIYEPSVINRELADFYQKLKDLYQRANIPVDFAMSNNGLIDRNPDGGIVYLSMPDIQKSIAEVGRELARTARVNASKQASQATSQEDIAQGERWANSFDLVVKFLENQVSNTERKWIIETALEFMRTVRSEIDFHGGLQAIAQRIESRLQMSLDDDMRTSKLLIFLQDYVSYTFQIEGALENTGIVRSFDNTDLRSKKFMLAILSKLHSKENPGFNLALRQPTISLDSVLLIRQRPTLLQKVKFWMKRALVVSALGVQTAQSHSAVFQDNLNSPAGASILADKTNEEVGGIDLNPANIDIQIRRDGKGIALPLSQQNMEQLMLINGFIPVIIDIKPVISLPLFTQLKSQFNAAATLASSR